MISDSTAACVKQLKGFPNFLKLKMNSNNYIRIHSYNISMWVMEKNEMKKKKMQLKTCSVDL